MAKQHFKMEDIQTLKDIIHPRDYMVKLDLKDAYFSVPVADDDRKYLRFKWAGECTSTHAFRLVSQVHLGYSQSCSDQS